MVEATHYSGITRLPQDVIRLTASFLRMPETAKLSLSCSMVYRCLFGSQAGRLYLTRQALSEILGIEAVVLRGHRDEDLPQALELYSRLVKHWTFSYGRLFSFKASAGFDMYPNPDFSPSNLYEGNTQSYSSCEILEGTIAIVTGVIVPESLRYQQNERLRRIFNKAYRHLIKGLEI